MPLESTLIESVRDDYGRIGGLHIPDYNESAEEFAARSGRCGVAIDVYFVAQRLPSSSAATGDDVTYQGAIYRFAEEAAAADYLARAGERLAQIAGSGLEAAPDAAAIGDASPTLAFVFGSGEQETRGYAIYAQVGRDVAQTWLVAQSEVPLQVVEELAAVQAVCLRSDERCEPMSVRAALRALAILATPAAGTPVS